MTVFRRSLLAIAPLSLSLVVAACGGQPGDSSAGSTSEADPDATLRINMPVSASLNPEDLPISATAMTAMWPVYDRLVQVEADNSYAPMLATEWEFSENGRELRMTLRTGATFSDGTPFDSSAAKTSLDFLRASDSGSTSAPLSTIESVVAVSPRELVIELNQASTAVLGALGTPNSGAMISPTAIEDGNLTSHPVGTGAYEVTGFKPGVSITYERRSDENWDPDAGQAKRIEITNYTSADAKNNAVRSGQQDLAPYSGGDAPALGGAIDAGSLQLLSTPSVLLYSVYMNLSKPPFDDVRVRRAVNLALDRDGLAALVDESATARVQPYPEGLLGFDPDLEKSSGFDAERAEELLADAGHPDGVDAGTLLVATTSGLPTLAQAIQANLAEVGITIEIEPLDTLQINAAWAKGTYEAMLYYQGAPDNEPVSYFNRQYLNPLWWVGPVPKDLAARLDGVGDPTVENQEQLIRGVNEVATRDAYFAPILQKPSSYVAAPSVIGADSAPFSQFGGADFRYIGLAAGGR